MALLPPTEVTPRMSIGPAEIVIVLILALLVFGPKRLPQMGRSLGKGVREFRKAADTAKTELGLSEVTDQINEVKSTFTEPIKEVTGTFGDLKSSVDLKSDIEAPVNGKGATAGTAGAAAAAVVSAGTPVSPATVAGAFEEGPETPAVTPQTAFADLPQAPAPAQEHPAAEEPSEAPEAPAAPESPEGPVAAGSPAGPATGA